MACGELVADRDDTPTQLLLVQLSFLEFASEPRDFAERCRSARYSTWSKAPWNGLRGDLRPATAILAQLGGRWASTTARPVVAWAPPPAALRDDQLVRRLQP